MSDEEQPAWTPSPPGVDYSRVVNPVEVEQNIARCANEIGKAVLGLDQVLRDYRAKERAFDLAYARAYARAEGAVQAKRYEADIATMAERGERDDAEAVYKYAQARGRALENELSAWQSIARSVVAMYGAAGVKG